MELSLRLDLCISAVLYLFLGIFGRLEAHDNFGLIYGMLRTFQAHACDNEELRLNCTSNTIININLVQYGRLPGSAHLCPSPTTGNVTSCRLDNALKIIEAKCHGQILCRMLISPDSFHEDPCPGVRKYAEVAYKCKPEQFWNKIVCEGEQMFLNCPDGQSMIVLSATFGSTSAEILECPQTSNIRNQDCQVSRATEIVAKSCSGQQKCSITADDNTFGSPSCMGRKYLKVVYGCVHRGLLKRLPNEATKPFEETIHTTSFPAWVRGVDQSPNKNHRFYGHARKATTEATIPFKSEMQSDEVHIDSEKEDPAKKQQLVGFISEWMSAHKYMAGNKDRLILYVSVSLAVGFLAFLTVIGVYFFIKRTGSRKSSILKITPIDDGDGFSSDSDLEHLPPPDNLPTPIVNYTASLRRHDSDAQPRAPVTTGTELNHYFS